MKKLLALAAIALCDAACELPGRNQDGKAEACTSEWTFTVGGREIIHYGFLPSEDGTAHKTFNDTFNFCQSHGLQSVVIHSREHQKDVTEKLEAMIENSGTGAAMHSNFWLSMERDQDSKEFNWKSWFEIPSTSDDYVEGYCPIDDSENGVEFWLTKPDLNSLTQHCAVMRINYDGITDFKNWESTACSSDQNGELGKSHGFVCIKDEDWNPLDDDCKIVFPTTTTTTTKSTTIEGGTTSTVDPDNQGSTTSTSKTPTSPNPDPDNPDNGSTSPSSTTSSTTTTTKESEDVNIGIIIGGVLGGLVFLVLLIFIIMRCLKPDNSIEDEEDEIDMAA